MITRLFQITLFTLINIAAIGQPDWQWASGSGGNSADAGFSISKDASGSVYVTGVFNSPTMTFGNITLFNSGAADIFIVKYDYLGNVLWAKSAGGTSYDNGNSICTDRDGNVYIAGEFFSSTITFDSTTLSNTQNYNMDIFIAKYDSSGNLIWAINDGGTSYDYCNSICTDTSGNIFITGYFSSSTINFGGTTLINTGLRDLYVVKFNANGNVLWAKNANGNDGDLSTSISADINGNVVITGYFYSDTISFGNITLINSDTIFNSDVFIAKYDINGNILWAKSAGGMKNDLATCVSIDNNENIFITGYFASSSFTCGSSTLFNDTTNGSSDVFFVKYDNNGNVLFSNSYGGPFSDYGRSVAADDSGNVYLSGSFGSFTITFGGTTLTNVDTPSVDMFILKYDASGNIPWAISAGGNNSDYCNSLTPNGNGTLYLTGGFASDTLTLGNTSLINLGTSDIYIAKLGLTTGIENLLDNKSITIYPNPNNGKFTITNDKINFIVIYNILGEQIYYSSIHEPSNFSIDLSENPNGIYLLQITSNEYINYTKLLKQ